MFFKKTIFQAILVPSLLLAQTYLWPTNSSKYLASSFCEYRPGHYHAAIDIKTWNKEGYPCYAVEDGKIHRINLSPHGAGKALYIKLKDGRFAVYFHLSKFPLKIEKELRELQIKQKKYDVEWWPKNWYVKKGEIVGFTGQTGIGVPHLHFEIRNASNVPVNPIPFFKDVKDNIRPQLNQLLVIPQNKNSSVNGSFSPANYSLKYIRDGVYVVDEPIYGNGSLGLAISGYDQADDVNNKLGFYSTKMYVNGKLSFEYAYDKISFAQTRFIDIDIYYPEKIRSGTRYNKLYLEPFNPLDFYNRKVGDGLIDIGNTSIPFEIEIKDFFGNVSILKGNIQPYGQHEVKVAKKNGIDRSAFFSLFIPFNVKSIEFYSDSAKTAANKIDYFEIVERSGGEKGTQALIKIDLPNSGINEIFASVIDEQDRHYDSQISVQGISIPKIHIESRLMGGNILFSFPDIDNYQNLDVQIIQNGRKSVYKDISKPEFVLSADEVVQDSMRFVLSQFNSIVADSTFNILKMEPGISQRFLLYNDTVMIETSNKSPYEKLLFDVRLAHLDSNIFNMPYLNKAVQIDGGGYILNRSMSIAIKPDLNFAYLDKASIYSMDDDDLDFEGGSYNPKTGYISTRTKTFGTYLVIADTLAPTFELFSPQKSAYNKLPPIRFKSVDNLSGIGDPENIEIYFDERYIVPEWDPERDLITGELHFTPQPGPHTIKIIIRDRVKNTRTETLHLTLK